MTRQIGLTIPQTGVQRELKITFPEICTDGACPVVLALHGSGRGIGDYDTVPFYVRQKEISLGYGYAFAVLQNGRDTYGTDEGVANVHAAVVWLTENISHGIPVTLWATSAGGICAWRYAAVHPENIRAIIGTFALYDLDCGLRLLQSCRDAWSGKDTSGRNPAENRALDGKIPIFLAHGTDDTAVPPEPNACRLAADTGAYLHMVEKGVHGTGDFRYYEKAPHPALSRCGNR